MEIQANPYARSFWETKKRRKVLDFCRKLIAVHVQIIVDITVQVVYIPRHQQGEMEMTEDQIERQVSRRIDRYDAAFMAGRLDQSAYDALMCEVNVWADAQYVLLAASKLRA